MANYDYKCDACATKATIIQPIHAGLVNPKCPSCKKLMARDYTAPGVTFKGDGWAHKEKGNK